MNSQIKKGLLDICVLSCINKEDSYGYKIIKTLDPLIKISESTLYTILKRLLTKKQIIKKNVIHNNRIRKYYSITDQGKLEIENFLTHWSEVDGIIKFIKEDIDDEEK